MSEVLQGLTTWPFIWKDTYLNLISNDVINRHRPRRMSILQFFWSFAYIGPYGWEEGKRKEKINSLNNYKSSSIHFEGTRISHLLFKDLYIRSGEKETRRRKTNYYNNIIITDFKVYMYCTFEKCFDTAHTFHSLCFPPPLLNICFNTVHNPIICVLLLHSFCINPIILV